MFVMRFLSNEGAIVRESHNNCHYSVLIDYSLHLCYFFPVYHFIMHICFTKKSIVVFLIWLTAIIILLVLEFQHDPSKVITQPDLQKIREANNLEHLNHVEVAMIFRHGSKNGRLQHNFKNAVTSLLKHSSQPVHLTLVCERPSYFVALRILSDVAYENPDIVPYEVSVIFMKLLLYSFILRSHPHVL